MVEQPAQQCGVALELAVGPLGIDAGDGVYLAVKIEKVLPRDPALIDAKQLADRYAREWGGAELQSFYNALKSEYKATIKPSALKAAAASAPTGGPGP